MGQRFGENIGNLLFCWAILDFNDSLSLSIMNKMILDVDVLCPIMSNRILNQFDGRLIIHIKWNRFLKWMTNLGEKSLNPGCFLSGMSCGNVFSLGR